MYCSPTVGLQAYREKELQTESEYDIIISIDVESTVMWSTWNFWMLRPFRLLKMSAAQGFARVRISQFHIVLACFSCILPEQGLHLRYTESCPRGRRCDTRNRGRYSVAPWPESLDFMGFSGILNLIFLLVLPISSPRFPRCWCWDKYGAVSKWS